MEVEPREGFSENVVQLAERYKVGQPVAIYEMQSWLVRTVQVTMQTALIIMTCALCYSIVTFLLLAFRYILQLMSATSLVDPRMIDAIIYLESKTPLGLPGLFLLFFLSIMHFLIRYISLRQFPVSLLICAEGMLRIEPKEVDVTYWDEVVEIRKEVLFFRRYVIYCNKHANPFFLLDDAFQDLEGLIKIIRQYTQK